MVNDREGAGSGKASLITDPMDQMREYLFGDARRQTEQSVQALDDKIESMRAEFMARFIALEKRLHAVAQESAQTQAESLEVIGSALAELGDALQTRGRQRKGD
jgi:predicted phage gp36 major capsid-like protein